MRKACLPIVVALSLAACSVGNVLSGQPYRAVDLLTGTWTGEAAGVEVTCQMDTRVCIYGCSNVGSGTWRNAEGDSGRFVIDSTLAPGGLGESVNLRFAADAGGPEEASFSGAITDSSHIAGHLMSGPDSLTGGAIFGVDSASLEITFEKPKQ